MIKTVHNLGMPFYGLSSKKGNLYVHFNIVFPQSLNNSQKEEITKVLNFQATKSNVDTNDKKFVISEYKGEENTNFKGGNRPSIYFIII